MINYKTGTLFLDQFTSKIFQLFPELSLIDEQKLPNQGLKITMDQEKYIIFRQIQILLSEMMTNNDDSRISFKNIQCYDPNTSSLFQLQNGAVFHNSLFTKIRSQSKISNDDLKAEFVNATTPGYNKSMGKSSSVFFFSQTGQFIIKSLKGDETSIFKRIVQEYGNYILHNQNSLIIKYLCFFSVSDITFVMMHNVFYCPTFDKQLQIIPQSALQPGKKYDLKGSSVGRQAGEKEEILKDNDVHRVFCINQQESVVQQIKNDAQWLQSNGFIDYSLVLGVTNSLKRFGKFYIQDNNNIADENNENKQFYNDIGLIDDKIKLMNLPAQLTKNYELIYLQIIDFFTLFTAKKKIELILKGMIDEKDKLSVADPVLYSTRFQQNVLKIFQK